VCGRFAYIYSFHDEPHPFWVGLPFIVGTVRCSAIIKTGMQNYLARSSNWPEWFKYLHGERTSEWRRGIACWSSRTPNDSLFLFRRLGVDVMATTGNHDTGHEQLNGNKVVALHLLRSCPSQMTATELRPFSSHNPI
jgi:hypothetical protein